MDETGLKMHRDRNNYSWSELKAKRNNSKFDDAPIEAVNVVDDDLVGTAHDTRKEKNDRAIRQLDGVKNMFKDMADYDRKQVKRSK